MAIEQDVLVIGGGIGGLSAALTAAREGADVRLVSYAESTLHHASGLLDVMGYTPDGEGPLVDPFAAVEDLPDSHPYAIVGEETLRDGMAMVDDVLADSYQGAHTDANALVPTHGGSVKPTARYPEAVQAGLASDERDVLFVGFDRLTDFDATVTATRLENVGIPGEPSAVTIEFPVTVKDDAKVTRFATLLDRNPAITWEGREMHVREALAEAVKPHAGDLERVGFPAVLGDDHPAEIRRELQERLGADVFEVPMGPPSILGLRLEDRLYAALEAAGGKVETGNPIVGFDARDGRLEEVYMDRSGQRIPYAAEQFVLATGGLAGQGIEADPEAVTEGIFDCHVPHPDDRYEWFEGDVFGDHPFAAFGVQIDAEVRPTDEGGHPEFPNLRAAGAVIGGYDYPAEKSASGVSIATGHGAGRRAAREV